MAKKVVFLGSKPIGYFCLDHLIKIAEESDIEIIGVLTNNNNKLGEADLAQLSNEHGIPVLSGLHELSNLEIDYLVSVQYHEILKQEHIDCTKELAVNLHMAPLPEYRGCNQFTFAILDDKKEFGTSIHVMEVGIDSGDLLFEKRFVIPENCFVDQLYELTYTASCELFSESANKLFAGEYTRTSQEELKATRTSSIHYRKEINDVKCIDLNWPEEKIMRHVRASDMPGFEPPYALEGNNKIYITRSWK